MTTGRRVVALLVLLLGAAAARAQISPGELAKVHAAIDGSAGCLKCHAPGKGVDPERCLACHTVLRDRVASGRGLHAKPDYRKCETCHIDHQGREAELRWWGRAGLAGFRHADTGYVLEGHHQGLACAKCHNPQRIANPAALARGGANAERTFLGLGTACLSCHTDVHSGQFGTRACDSCHTQQTWKPAALFDHARTKYPLAGRHASVACEKCHPVKAAGAAGPRVFASVPFSSCASCHRDPHQGRLGAACASCHSPNGWSALLKLSAFDHSRTMYPLEGAHRTVACDKCHKANLTAKLRFSKCSDCHADAHRGEFAARPDKGACESCHEVAGFANVRFGLDEHQRSAWPLSGAHRAVPCDKCHRRAAGERTAAYRVAHAVCTDCHADPHRGGMKRFSGAAGCATCHTQDSWRRGAFDHAATRFPLVLGHSTVPCASCHKPVAGRRASEPLAFTGLVTTCASCHEDIHAGQFAKGGVTACDRCHEGAAFRPAPRFDHNRDASWPLDGRHVQVPCASCHRGELREGRNVVRYKPLATSCAACHSGRKP